MSAAAEILRMPDVATAGFFPFFDNAPLAIMLCDVDGNITLANPALDLILGGKADLTHAPLRLPDLIHPQDRPEAEHLISVLSTGKQNSFQIETKILDSGRGVRWTVWKAKAAYQHKGTVFAVAEPLATAPAAQEGLRQAQRLEAVGRLAGSVAHDFNNLLTGVLLYCDLLIASLETGHRARKYAEEIRKAGFQATAVVRQLLDIAKPTNYPPRLLSLNEVAEGMGNLLARLIGENVRLKFHLDPDLGLVKIDPTHVQQVLLNLVLNARDAMPQGGEISVETANCKVQILPDLSIAQARVSTLACALLVVRDNGHGMDEAIRTHVFEPFFTTKAGKGTGLGLATVYEIVTSNGGLIFVDSAPGQGTRVRVLLPLAPQESTDSSRKATSPFSNTELTLSQAKESKP